MSIQGRQDIQDRERMRRAERVERAEHIEDALHVEDVETTENVAAMVTIDTTCTRMPNGELVIRLTPTADRRRIRWMREWFGSAYALATALDYEREHGWAWVQPEDVGIGNMTQAPMVTDDGRYDATSRRLKVWGSLWWYPDYRTCDPVELLLTRGAVTFQPFVMRGARTSQRVQHG